MFDLFEKWDGTQRPGESSSSSATTSSSSSGASSPDPYAMFANTISASNSYNGSKTFVLSVGGSVFFDQKLRAPEIAKFCEAVNDLIREGYEFVLVVGGGSVARVYLAGAKALGANNCELDEVGIAITRANALLFTYNISNAWKVVLSEPKDAENILHLSKTPVFGGNLPGQTTDAVAAIIAELLNASFINLSNVDGIYSADPAKEDRAKLFAELSHTKMVALLKAAASKPGAHTFIDPHAANILWRSKVKSYFINGSNLENFKALIRGQTFRGTIVQTGSSADVAIEEDE